MTPKWIKSSPPTITPPPPRRPRRGLTLVEVVAGLALMASVVSSMLYAKARFDAREADAQRRLRAAAAADALLATWWRSPETFPRAAGGEVASDPALACRTRPVPNAAASRIGGQIVRLEVSARQSGSGSEVPLAVVDVVLPVEGER